jgi:predicted nuclease of predicted toxin-antitoxin system
MKLKLLVDMNLSPRWIGLLIDAGLQAVHWSTVGRADSRDAEIMAWAATNDHVVLTHDLDFSAILAATQCTSPSVVQIRAEDVSPDVIGTRVIMALHQTESELEAGALLSIDASRMRLRLLPLKKREEGA